MGSTTNKIYEDEMSVPANIILSQPSVYKGIFSGDKADYGDNITVEITINNPSSGDITVEKITDIIPQKYNVHLPVGSMLNCSFDNSSRVMTCNVSIVITKGGSAKFYYNITPTSALNCPIDGCELNIANLTPTITSRDNCGKDYTTQGFSSGVVNVYPPILTATKTASTSPVQPGQTFTYTITIKNEQTNAKGTAYNVTVNDEIPSQLGYITAVSSKGTLSISNVSNNYTFTTDASLGPGDTMTITITVKAKSCPSNTTVTNKAT
ncbi:MAG: hypothetical protein CVT89_00575, partial [Candidatus Altiarchaeales archaeon HGW-Altiarchaeales-2]